MSRISAFEHVAFFIFSGFFFVKFAHFLFLFFINANALKTGKLSQCKYDELGGLFPDGCFSLIFLVTRQKTRKVGWKNSYITYILVLNFTSHLCLVSLLFPATFDLTRRKTETHTHADIDIFTRFSACRHWLFLKITFLLIENFEKRVFVPTDHFSSFTTLTHSFPIFTSHIDWITDFTSWVIFIES